MDDFALALQLQEEFNLEYEYSSSGKSENEECFETKISPEKITLIDEKWELLDPNPDIRAMFLQFNDHYFWGKLAGVEIRWSPRMTA